MYYIDTKSAASIYGVGERAVRLAVERNTGKYFHLYIDGSGRGGKKLLIGVSEQQLGEAMNDGLVEPEAEVYDEAGLPTQFKPPDTGISDTNNEKHAPDMKEFLNASEAQRSKTLLRLDLLDLYEKESSKKTVATFIEQLPDKYAELKVTETKLYRWRNAREDAKTNGDSPLVALLDKRGAKKGKTQLSQEQQEMAIRMLCRRDNPLRVSAIYQNMLHAFGDAMPSYDVLNNFLNRWKIENQSLYEFAQDADGWKNNRLAAFGSLSEKAKYPNHYWELDSTPADVILKDGKRYTVLCAIDIYSRRAVYWVDERSSSYAIARLMRKAILRFGIPENVVIDNGKDYKSNHFASICHNLEINQQTVPPFSGDMKPHVERVFGTLSRELFEEMEGFIGHDVAERSRIESRRGFAHKIESKSKWYEEARKKEKKAFTEGFRIKKENLGLELKVSLDAEQLQGWIDAWNENIYEKRKHGSLDRSPLQQWHRAAEGWVKGIPDPRMLDILLGESFERKVGKKGIRLQGALYQHVALAEYVGHHVRLMTDDDMGRVFVYRMNYAPICIAEDYEYTGKSRAELAEGKRISSRIAREHAKLLEEWEEASRKMDPSIKDRIEASAAEAGTPLPVMAVTKPTEIIHSVLEASKTFAEQDAAAAEDSNIMTMEGEKLTPSGRPQFRALLDRFVWDIANGMVDDDTKRLAEKKPEIWELAEKESKRKSG